MRGLASSRPFLRETAQKLLRRPGALLPVVQLLLPTEAHVALPGMERLCLRPTCLDRGSAALDRGPTGWESFALDGEAHASLWIERPLARQLVNRLFGRPTSWLPSPLSGIERGLLCGLVAAVTAKLGLCLGIQADAAPDQSANDAGACVQIMVAMGDDGGRLHLRASEEALERCWKSSALWSQTADALLSIELARTEVPRAEALAASAGDIVAFDETPALSPSSSLPLRIRCGGKQVVARLSTHGRLSLASEPPEPITVSLAATSSPADVSMVAVVAEIVSWCDAVPESALSAVSDLACERLLLRMGDLDWGEGSPCEVDGRLGVRLSRTFAG